MSQASKKSGGRSPSDLWNTHIKKGKEIFKGHYKEICNYCSYSKHKGSSQDFEEHLANNCPNVPISWKTISNPFFIDFLKTLQQRYIPPSHEVLSGHLFSQKSCDGWTNLSNESIWGFFIYIPDHCEYLWSLKDLSAQSHTANLIAEELDKIIQIIGSNKYSAIVTDTGANVQNAREIISTRYNNILNIH
ncbi:zinc finger bed domain-containing protein 1-like [Gigaspora margarita]|uniref:Zinc finger bed domain-containing protein 1-like n=1 Tax=Gigaspora margarita TaxID=4874 RepID=A0A8H4ANI6_GIGMA|nr:zinc finger bed domain-containing protein 1-like [Gigaspora margarita]